MTSKLQILILILYLNPLILLFPVYLSSTSLPVPDDLSESVTHPASNPRDVKVKVGENEKCYACFTSINKRYYMCTIILRLRFDG